MVPAAYEDRVDQFNVAGIGRLMLRIFMIGRDAPRSQRIGLALSGDREGTLCRSGSESRSR